jgi:ferritin-like metal-binding protein YciE
VDFGRIENAMGSRLISGTSMNKIIEISICTQQDYNQILEELHEFWDRRDTRPLHHLEETEAQIERLEECFALLDIQPRAKACKGMMGIVEEGEEVMAEGKRKDETAADLALIGAAQKVEHYEMSGYITARNLAQQLHMAPIVQLLQLSLGEEENADQLLNQLARPLMSVAKMPESVE